jgi:magnesium transporter
VVDSANRLIGALTVDDAMDVLDMDTSATMYGKAGITDPGHATEVLRSERLVAGGIGYPVRVRLLFLMVTLAGGLAVGGLIEQFEDTLAAVVALAIFVPLVMDMGGNVGTQSTTIFARGLALGQIQLSHMRSHIAREARVGLVMGAVIGVVGGSIALVWQGVPNDIPQLGLAVGISLFVSVNLACFLGFFLPWVLIKLGFDHAPGADPFITTIKDFTGLLVYFGLAAWVLNIA